MKRSIIWTTAGIAAIGFAVPAFATNGNTTKPTVPTPVNVTVSHDHHRQRRQDQRRRLGRDIIEAAAVTSSSLDDDATSDSIDDDATTNSIDDDATTNSIDDDATTNSVEDVSGNCDEAEHANDAACTGAVQDDDAADDDSGHGSDDSGHGSDDSGHGSATTDRTIAYRIASTERVAQAPPAPFVLRCHACASPRSRHTPTSSDIATARM